MKLLAIATHPIQYQAPWFRALAETQKLDLTVAFGLIPTELQQSVGFDVPFTWDLPLLDGYRWLRLDLKNKHPAIDRFGGLRARRLRGVLAGEQPDAILVTGWNSWLLIQAAAMARRMRIPTLVRGESNDLRRRPVAIRWIQRILLGSFAAVLAIGIANRKFLRARGIPDRRIFSAPYFVDNERFQTQAASLLGARSDLRAFWGIAECATCILFAGKLIDKKRPLDLAQAVAKARAAGADLHLLLAGEGELRGDVERATRELGVPTTFAGFLNQREIARAYVAADLLVLPSDAGETWGLVVNEAMACGRPTIVSDRVGCAADLIREEETGWSYPCADTGALASLLGAAANRRAFLAGMGIAAQRRVLEGYSIARSVDGTVRACEFAIRERRQ